jgi:ATP-dependent DNA helicase PIF1
MWPGETIDMFSADRLLNAEDRYACSVEFLQKQCISGIPDHHLRVKIGVPLLLTTNLSFVDGACNGTRLILDSIVNREHRTLLACRIMNGPGAGKTILINRIDVIQAGSAVSGGRGLPWPWVRRAFPVKLAFCCTINKSQGQTLETVGILLTKPVFTHGQAYVAASRVGDAKSVFFFIPKAKESRGRRLTRNVVYHEVLSADAEASPAPSPLATALRNPDCTAAAVTLQFAAGGGLGAEMVRREII